MKKVMPLVRVQLWAMIAGFFAIGEQRKKKTKALFVGFAFFFLMMSGTSFFYAYGLGTLLNTFNIINALPSLFMALSSVMVLFTTVFKVKGTIFGFKDYDMVMSLPVKNSEVVASRLILLYSINLVFVLIVMLPMTVAYGIIANPNWVFYLYSIISIFLIPLLPIIIASILGTVITYVAMGFRYSNAIYMVLSFILFFALMIIPFFMQGSEEAFAKIHQVISNQINNLYPLAALYSRAVNDYDLASMIIFAIISIVAFMVFSLVVGKSFVRINTLIMTGSHRSNYKLGELKTSSPMKSLFKKELKRYFASNVYVMNTVFGMLILVIMVIALPFIDTNTIVEGIDVAGAVEDIIPVIITFCISTSCTTMASISIEGQNLWITKSLPVSVKNIFLSKILVNLFILSPGLISTIAIGIILKINFVQSLITILTVIVFSLFVAQYGLVINLTFPNLKWSSETIIVKQSTSSMISIFSGMALVGVQVALLVAMGSSLIANLIFIGILLILNLLLYKRLTGRAIRQFEKLY
ncbi:MAG: hypothetical protein GX237_06630 [Clostridiales bacterium]|nr:hypothetical protein [Clostridiales bacterium]